MLVIKLWGWVSLKLLRYGVLKWNLSNRIIYLVYVAILIIQSEYYSWFHLKEKSVKLILKSGQTFLVIPSVPLHRFNVLKLTASILLALHRSRWVEEADFSWGQATISQATPATDSKIWCTRITSSAVLARRVLPSTITQASVKTTVIKFNEA